MAVDYLAPNRVQFDYLQSLQSIGQAQAQQQQTQMRGYQFQQQQRQDQARPAIQQRAAGGDFTGAQQDALASGDYDLAKSIGGLADDHRKKLATESDWMGRAANALRRVPEAQRASVFSSMLPTLQAQGGFHADELHGVDLSDGGLDRFITLSQSIKDQLASSLTQARIDDVGTDNTRQDRLADNTVRNTTDQMTNRRERLGLAYRADGRAGAARSESHVRFRERDKDRAAIAAGGRGVRNDLSDLDY
ncbi:hypothetical protein QP150_16210 [Sphingomonas sp. 22L2VL55-3]